MARRLALWFGVLAAIALVAGAVAPRDEQPSPPVFPAPRPPGVEPARSVVITMPSHHIERARVGDAVELRINVDEPDRAMVDGLGVSAPVGPGTSGSVEFLAEAAGKFTVELRASGTRLGAIEIDEPE